MPGDVVAHEHWCSSRFANTDLDQQLKVHEMERLIIIGLVANTCVEATARCGAELGYDLTLVKDATSLIRARHPTGSAVGSACRIFAGREPLG